MTTEEQMEWIEEQIDKWIRLENDAACNIDDLRVTLRHICPHEETVPSDETRIMCLRCNKRWVP